MKGKDIFISQKCYSQKYKKKKREKLITKKESEFIFF